MRGSLLMVFVGVGVAGWFAVACGDDSGEAVKCSNQAIAHGHTVQCEASGAFDNGAPAYTCAPNGTVSTKTFMGEFKSEPSSLCPVGTHLVVVNLPPNTVGESSSSGGNGSSSGGSSSGDLGSQYGGSSSGGSSSGDHGTTSSSSSSSGGDGHTPTTSSSSSSGDVGNTSSSSSSSGGDTTSSSSSSGSDTTSSSSSSGSDTTSSSSSSSSSSSGGGGGVGSCDDGYVCTPHGKSATCTCTKCDQGYHAENGVCVPKGNNGVGNGVDPQPPGNPPVNDGPGTSPGDPGNKGGAKK